ncbi:LacI family transcriptional regulator [Salipiger sp. IMCC34102]|uniref:LacI family DNA-binding transcriptional regulator n=1 Tax=Salipiger sp. IMCC34102 TaxID=2510647 RepID=UPI00101C1148|nr:LacI family DNA-binding transcriptional regulator [Salipiger sp. IMCC34102]RYH02118.1 LacI family transcriptional regulator [Salipiger sp. IMCC34102]
MAVTLHDVAVRAGVSKSAVSRTFTPGASVSPAMRVRVERAARELGYQPNVLASSLTTGRTKLIGLISNNFTNPYFLEIFDAFTRALQDADLRPLLLNLSGAADAGESLTKLRQYSVDGVIVASSTLPPQFATVFQDAGIPVVHAFGWSSPVAGTAFAGIDNAAAGRFAAQTLLARGYRDVGFLGGPEHATTTQERLAGFQSALTGSGKVATVHFARDYSYAAGHEAMTVALRQGPVEAWFCGDDVIAVGALQAARAADLRVPQDLGLLGLNDMAIAGWSGIELTTIVQPLGAIVDAAVGLIQRGIADPEAVPEHRMLPFGLAERGTLGPPV